MESRASAQIPDPLADVHRPRLAPGEPANPGPAQPIVWITDGLAKVKPDSPPGDTRSIELAAARNEFESFQVHVRARAESLRISVAVSDFVNPGSGKVLAADPNVAVFREEYLNVTILSDENGVLGRIPDPLIPVRDAYLHQPRNAFPVTAPPNETRSAWVDVFIPPTTESGYYTASVKVTNGPDVIATLPVLLKVWNFTLPSTASLKSYFGMGYGGFGFAAYGNYQGVAAYPGSGGNSETALALIHTAVAKLFLDHRVSVGPVVSPTSPAGQWKQFDSLYGPVITGGRKPFCRARG